ncbi:unnamed protein product, partial [Laminaria digitata]
QATVDYEAQDEAVLAKILMPEGSPDVAVGTPIMVLIENIDDVAAFKDFSVEAGAGGGEGGGGGGTATFAPTPAPVEVEVAPPTLTPAAAAPAATPTPALGGSGARVAASPLAKMVSGGVG